MSRPSLAARITAAIALAAGSAHAADKTDLILERGKTIACASNPFGAQISLGLEQEIVVSRVQTNGTVTHHQLDASGASAFAAERMNTTGLTGISRVRTATIDLDGDGRQEVAVVGVLTASPGVVQVRVLRPSSSPTANELVGTYSWNSGATGFQDIEVAAGDIDGSRDGRTELVILGRRQGSGLTAIALSGTATGAIAQSTNTVLARWDQPASQVSTSANARVAVGDVLLEGRDQVLVMTTRGNDLGALGYNLLRFEDVDNPATPDLRFNASPLFSESINNQGTDVATQKITLNIADLGGTPQREIVIHDQRSINGAVFNTIQRVRHFDVVRAQQDAGPITSFSLAQASDSLNFKVQTQNSTFAASVGNFDRTPGNELAISYQAFNGQVRTEVRKVEFTGNGVSSAIATLPVAQIDVPAINQPLFSNMDAVAGDRDGDSLFEHYLVLRDGASGGGSNVTKLWRFGFARPSPVANPVNPATFARTAAYEFATSLPETTELQVLAADWNNDTVLARIGSNCRRVREPQVRSVVAMPPYWMRLQGGLDGFGASIGRSITSGAGAGSQYDTFSSHDISAYVGVEVGGEVLGIGASVTAKATAGYNYQTTRSTFSETSFETTATQSQFSDSVDGEGLVVVELNTYDCYDFEVLRNGAPAENSDFRACELIRSENGVNLRSLQSTDLLTWDTVTAAGAGSRPAQWFPLHQDWANIALFRPVTANVGSAPGQANLTDGVFSTSLSTAGATNAPFVQIDLGEVRDVTAIRVWPQAGQATTLRGFNLYASETAFAGPALPSGANVRTFQPDPLSGNGVESWAVWTRDALNGATPMRALHPPPAPWQRECARGRNPGLRRKAQGATVLSGRSVRSDRQRRFLQGGGREHGGIATGLPGDRHARRPDVDQHPADDRHQPTRLPGQCCRRTAGHNLGQHHDRRHHRRRRRVEPREPQPDVLPEFELNLQFLPRGRGTGLPGRRGRAARRRWRV